MAKLSKSRNLEFLASHGFTEIRLEKGTFNSRARINSDIKVRAFENGREKGYRKGTKINAVWSWEDKQIFKGKKATYLMRKQTWMEPLMSHLQVCAYPCHCTNAPSGFIQTPTTASGQRLVRQQNYSPFINVNSLLQNTQITHKINKKANIVNALRNQLHRMNSKLPEKSHGRFITG